MSILLRDVLKLGGLNGITVLAGESGLDRVVKSTTILDAPDAVQWLSGYELAFTSTYPLQNSHVKLDWLIEEMARRNVSGLGVKLNRFMKEIPAEMLQAAECYSFPILSLPIEKAWIDFINPIMTRILNQQTQRLLQSEMIYQQFTKILLDKASLQTIIQLLHDHIGSPLSIYCVYDQSWTTCLENPLQEPDGLITKLLAPNNTMSEILPGVYHTNWNKEEYLYVPFPNIEQTEGFILLSGGPSNSSFQLVDILSHAKNAISLKVIQNKAEMEFRGRYKNEYILQLIQNTYTRDSCIEIKRKATELGLPLADYYNVFTFWLDEEVEGSLGFYQDLSRAFRELNLHLTAFDPEDHLVLLYPSSDNETIMNQDLQSFIGTILPKDRWVAGISQRFHVTQLREGYYQSLKCLYLNIEIGNRGFIHFDQIGIYRLFSHPAQSEEIHKFVEQMLVPIMQYDEQNQSELMVTLQRFLENGGNQRETAKSLFVHHNTVRYRLQTISKLSNLDIFSTEVKLQYQIALLLLPLSREIYSYKRFKTGNQSTQLSPIYN